MRERHGQEQEEGEVGEDRHEHAEAADDGAVLADPRHQAQESDEPQQPADEPSAGREPLAVLARRELPELRVAAKQRAVEAVAAGHHADEPDHEGHLPALPRVGAGLRHRRPERLAQAHLLTQLDTRVTPGGVGVPGHGDDDQDGGHDEEEDAVGDAPDDQRGVRPLVAAEDVGQQAAAAPGPPPRSTTPSPAPPPCGHARRGARHGDAPPH